MRRIFANYQLGGAHALCHASRHRPGRPQYPPATKHHTLSIVRDTLIPHGYTPAHMVDILAHEHDISLSAPTLRSWMRAAHLIPEPSTPHTRRPATHHTWRAPRTQRGALLQGDGSFHHWFGPLHPPCCLLVLIDDATNTIMLRVAEQEYIRDMLILLKEWTLRYGIPQSLYFDKRNAYTDTDTSPMRHIPQVCTRLGIELITAHSPQAKGRVERVNRTLQARLVPELSRHRITTITQANEFVRTSYVPIHNNRFMRIPLSSSDSHVPLYPEYPIDRVFAYHGTRVLRHDWTISLDGVRFQIVPTRTILAHTGKRISFHRFLDNSLHFFYNDTSLDFKEIDTHAVLLE